MKETILKICELLIKNNITDLEWSRIKYFIDLQYKEEKTKTTFKASEDSLKKQLAHTNFYSIGSTDWSWL